MLLQLYYSIRVCVVTVIYTSERTMHAYLTSGKRDNLAEWE